MLRVGQTSFVHEVRADLVLPQIRDDLETLLQVARVVRHNVHITTPRAPESERAVFLHERLDRRALVLRERCRDLLDTDLDADCADWLRFLLHGEEARNEVVVPFAIYEQLF